VPEYDAFGREIGEDSLAALRQTGETPPRDHDDAAVREARAARDARADEASDAADAFGMPDAKRREEIPVADTQATVSAGSADGDRPPKPVFVAPSRAQRRPARRGIVAALVIVLTVVVGMVGIAAVGIIGAGSAVVDQIGDLAPSELDTGGGPEPVGLGDGSLLRPAAFERAIATLRDAGGRADSLRVAPARIDTQLVRGSRRRVVQVQPGGELRVLATISGVSAMRAPLDWDRIDPRAPERLTRAVARRLKLNPRRIDYLVVSADPAQWGAYFKNGRIAFGDRRGRVTRILPG
jgi:hypothetical protein